MNKNLNYRDIRPIPDALAQAVGDGFFAIWPPEQPSGTLVPKGQPMDIPDKWGWATCPRCAKGFRYFKHGKHRVALYCLGCARY